MNSSLRYELREGVAHLILVPAAPHRPPTMEAALLRELDNTLERLEQAEDVELVVLRSASQRFFCVGADVGALEQLRPDTVADWIALGHRVLNRLEDLPHPVCAWVEGFALGGGLELAMACDFLWAAPGAEFGQPEGKLGVVTGWGGCWRLSRRIGLAPAKALIYSGRIVNEGEAREAGLVDRIIVPDEREAAIQAFRRELGEGSRAALRAHKRILNGFSAAARAEMMTAEIEQSRRCLAEPDTQRRIADFLAARKNKAK